MKAAPIASLTVEIELDGKRLITYDKQAVYKIGTLKRPSTVQDLLNNEKSFSALVQWLWACMSPKDAVQFTEPETLVPLINEDNISTLFAAFYKSYKATLAPEDKSPLPSGSPTGPLPSSS